MSEFSRWARDFICYNQGKFIEFSYTASELHKELGRAVDQQSCDAIDAVAQSRSALCQFLEDQIALEAAPESFKYLHRYFSQRSQSTCPPRFCLKTKNQSGLVVTLARDENVPYPSNFSLKDHSAFDAIEQDGQYVLLEDLAAHVRQGYRNARLDRRKVEAFLARFPSSTNEQMSHEEQEAWMSCWKPATTSAGQVIEMTDPRWCYRSVLIVPVTLRYNKLSPAFYEEINRKMQETLPHGNIGRYIFAYLCMDHAEKNFFCEPSDVDVGYMVADVLSLYLIDQMLLVETSGTYSKATQKLIDCGMEVEGENQE